MTDFVDYPLVINGTRPSEMPMARLAKYMAEYASFLGSTEHIHFDRVEEGSLELHAYAPSDYIAIISPRVRSASMGDETAPGYSPWRRLNDLLAQDGLDAELPLPNGGETIRFPGREHDSRAIRTVTQATSIQGRLIKLSGAGDVIHVGLEMDGSLPASITVDVATSHSLSPYWHKFIRLSGDGRWKRDEKGRWMLDRIHAKSFEPLEDIPIGEALDRLRKIITPGTGEAIIKAVDELRRA